MMRADPYYRKLITSPRWSKLRAIKLKQEKGLCEECAKKGIIRSATEVHHIVPILQGHSKMEMELLAYDLKNLECVCADCHIALHEAIGSKKKGYIVDMMSKRSEDFVKNKFGI